MKSIGTAEFAILECDVPTKYSTMIYPRAVVQKAISNHALLGLGTLDTMGELALDASKVSHQVIDMWIDSDNIWYAKISFLDTVKGHLALQMHMLGILRLTSIGICSTDMHNVMSDYRLIYTTLLLTGPSKSNSPAQKIKLGISQ